MVTSKEVQLPQALTVKELADLLGVSAVDIIKELSYAIVRKDRIAYVYDFS